MNQLTADRPWSYSRLSAYELCPRKYAAEQIERSVAQAEGTAQAYGKEVHSAFDKRCRQGIELPLDLQHHEPAVIALLKFPGKIVTEQRIALNRNFAPTGFFDDDVWFRAIIDLMIYNPKVALIVDWKTGRIQPDFSQLDLMAAAVKGLVPTLEKIRGLFYWTKGRKNTRKDYTPDSLKEVWRQVLPRVNRYQKAHVNNDFPPRPCFLCKRHCAVTGCNFNGK